VRGGVGLEGLEELRLLVFRRWPSSTMSVAQSACAGGAEASPFTISIRRQQHVKARGSWGRLELGAPGGDLRGPARGLAPAPSSPPEAGTPLSSWASGHWGPSAAGRGRRGRR